VIEEGRREVSEAGLDGKEPILLTAGGVDELHLSVRFDIIWAFQVIIHMTDEILLHVVEFMAAHLDRGGKAYATVRVGPACSNAWQGFPSVRRPLEFYVERFGSAGLRVQDIGSLTDFGHDIPGRTIEQQASRACCSSSTPGSRPRQLTLGSRGKSA